MHNQGTHRTKIPYWLTINISDRMANVTLVRFQSTLLFIQPKELAQFSLSRALSFPKNLI